MQILSQIIIGLVAFFHLYILWMEMFAWETRGPKVFKSFPKELFASTKSLAANLGLYNGFLAVGLIWTFFINDIIWKENIAIFFLSCVTIAGIYGAITAEKRIFFVQSVPALLGIILLLLN